MQPHSDVPFEVSGFDPDVFEAWTRTGLWDSNRTIDVMHPDRLMDLRSLVRKKPLISREKLVKKGIFLNWNEARTTTSKSIDSHEARHSAKQTREMAKDVQGTIEALKKRMDISDEEGLEDHLDGDRVNQVTSTNVAAARVMPPSPLSGVKVGPSLSTKLNYILSEVCLHTCLIAWITSRTFVGPAILCEGEVLDILQFSPYALSNRRGLVTL